MHDPSLKAVFVSLFRRQIRVLFDWQRLASANWPVTMQVVNSPDVLANWFMPWNVDADGNPANYELPAARPIRVRTLPEILDRFDDTRKSRIDTFTAAFRRSKRPAQFLVPLYAPNARDAILLDGNHRVAAAFTCGGDLAALAFTLHGPADPSMLPELRHWTSGNFQEPTR